MAESQGIEFFEKFTFILRDMQLAYPFGVGKAIYLYFNKLLKQIQDPNKKKILSNIGICPEICYAMDLVPIQQELTSTLCAAIGTSVEYLDSAIEAGMPQGYLCNFQKVWIGAMILKKLPIPDLLVFAPEPCDSMHENYQFIQNLYNIPAFGFDIPYWTHEKNSPYYSDAISDYMGNQVKKMVSFLEKHTNSKLDPEKLKETMEKSNAARQNILEILEFCKAVPSPMPSSILTPFLILLSCLLGTDEAIHLTKSVRDEVYSRFKNKQGHIALTYKKKTEKLRLLWLLIPIAWDLGISNWMERKYGCITIMDILSIYLTKPIDTTSLESIYRDLGKAVIDYPMGRQYRGPIEFFLDDVLRICRDYKIDAAVLGGHNCKNVFAVRKLISETLDKEAGIKTLELEADSLDPRVKQKKDIKKALSRFLDRVTEEKYGIEK